MPEQQEYELKQAFIHHLPERLSSIQGDWQLLTRDNWDRRRAASLYHRLQSLAGSSGRHGLAGISESALALELQLKRQIADNTAPEPGWRETTQDLLTRLRHEAELAGNRRAGPESEHKRVYLLDIGDDLAPGLTSLLQDNGYRVAGFSHADGLEGEVQRQLPDILILSGRMLGRMSSLNRELAVQQDLHKRRVGIICLGQSQDLEQRLLALRNGVDAYLVVPVSNRDLLDKVAELSASDTQQYRVLIVEDDRSQADFAASILRKSGMKTSVTTDPMEVLHALDRFRPDLVLMDLYMPDADGIELTRIIREHPDFVSTPIVFLSGEQDTDKKLHALSVGGDDFLSKPIRPRHLVDTIRNRVQRARALNRRHHSSSDRDRESGLFTRRLFYQRLEEISTAMGEESIPGAVLHIRMQPGADTSGKDPRTGFIASLGNVVSKSIEAQDTAARLDDNSFGILLQRPNRSAILYLARLLVQRLHALEAGEVYAPGIGIALFEQGLHDSADLVAEAAQASRLARAETGWVKLQESGSSKHDHPVDQTQWPRLLQEALQKNSLQCLYTSLRSNRGDPTPLYSMKFRLLLSGGRHLGSTELLGVAAQHDLGTELSQWLIDQALSMLNQEHADGKQTVLFVPQATTPIFRQQLIDWLRDRLRARQMVGSGLVLEYRIAELSKELRIARRHFEQLHEMDIRVSLSRFGGSSAALKVLDYLGADFVRLAGPVLNSDSRQIEPLQQAIHEAGARSILPTARKQVDIAAPWLEVADLLPASLLDRLVEE